MKIFKFIFLALIVSIQFMSANIFAASVDSRVSTLINLDFDSTTKIYGLTALDSLGKKTGTLPEFANKMSDENTDYLVFPANFFHSYDDVKDVVGGIYSQGKLINDSWFDYGCGFDKNNTFYLFKLISTVSNEPGGEIVIHDNAGHEVKIVTAFNCYPWFIKDGAKLEIKPMPGADSNYLNSKARRAFMGQRADGTFMYGIVNNATIYELQGICADLDLVNAVNTDGGASAGAYRNGKYVASPGRELASAVCITNGRAGSVPANEAISQPSPIVTPATAETDGTGGKTNANTSKDMWSVNIILTIGSTTYKNNGQDAVVDVAPYISEDGRTMVPIRIISEALGASVEWNANTQTDTIQKAGLKLDIVVGQQLPNNLGMAVLKDNRLFVPVRYISEQLGANVEWNAETQTVTITQ
jgi:hypothetical protein